MRKHYLDNIRWFTVCCVVVYHIIYIYSDIAPAGVVGAFSETQYQDAIQYLLYPWFMVLLFIVAGMCSRYYLEKHTVKEFVRSRTRKLLVPSTVGILLLGWMQGYISMSLSSAFESITDSVPKPIQLLIMDVSGTSVLWFIQMLWIFSMILALVRRLEKGGLYSLTSKAGIITALLLGVPVYFSGLVLNTPIIAVYRFGIYGLTFFLGYFLFAHDEVIDRVSRFSIPLIIAAAALGALYLYTHWGDNYATAPVVSCVPAVAYCWTACLAILGAFRKYADKTDRFASFMSSRSFGLYIFHYFTLSAAALLLDRYTSLPAAVCYPIVTASAFLGGLLLYEIVSRIPFLRWCLLGMKSEKRIEQKG